MLMSPSLLSLLLIIVVTLLVLLASWKRLPDLGVALSIIIIALATWLRPGGLENLGFLPVEDWLSLFVYSFIAKMKVNASCYNIILK